MIDLAQLAPDERARILADLTRERERRGGYKMRGYFQETGPYRRALYDKHVTFMALGATKRERLFMAGNRVGKTELGAFEVTAHLTGEYPDWWTGKRYAHPTRAWAAGDTSTTVRDILQIKLVGPQNQYGTGMIPGHAIKHVSHKTSAVQGAIDTIWVNHASGGTSVLTLKSYDQRREAFQGTEMDFIWLDEEPPMDIYTECLLRTMTTEGMIVMTFTPLMGMTELVVSYLDSVEDPNSPKAVVQCEWDEVPHLSAESKAALYGSIPAHQRDARRKGIPELGAGAIYTVPIEDLRVEPFQVPKHWPRAYGMDVGWNWTAAAWGAWDRDNDTVFVYDVYKRGEVEPAIHATAIKARGLWIPGVIDPAAQGSNQIDGRKLMDVYRGRADRGGLGLDLNPADHAVSAGILEVWGRLSTGRLKVVSSCAEWFKEYSTYRRDTKGRVVKKNDHLMDATRYLIMSGLTRAITEPEAKPPEPEYLIEVSRGGIEAGTGWMQVLAFAIALGGAVAWM